MRWEEKQIYSGPLLELATYNHIKVTYHGLGSGTQEEGEAGKGP